MKFMNVTAWQLLFLAIAISVISAVTSCAFTFYMDYRLLPMVYRDGAGTCVKVENFENGHAFNCNDVDVSLRRYRQPKKS
ncbi:hypothetical protein [Acinetobacter sp.]|uniref:hypothetical protein n=1 Tax=Acinetobacter sp. TaxID=472 RepID=UPI0038904413